MTDAERLEKAREAHRQMPYESGSGPCFECSQPWPCITAMALDEAGRLRRERDSLRVRCDYLDAHTVPGLRAELAEAKRLTVELALQVTKRELRLAELEGKG